MGFAALAVGAVAVTHAASNNNDSVRTETVRYGDLNLGKPEGAAALFRRLHNAAADVCGDPVEDRYSPVPRYQRCMNRAMGDAVVTVDEPALTAYAQARGVALKDAR
jgi:UrcA family protein